MSIHNQMLSIIKEQAEMRYFTNPKTHFCTHITERTHLKHVTERTLQLQNMSKLWCDDFKIDLIFFYFLRSYYLHSECSIYLAIPVLARTSSRERSPSPVPHGIAQ